MHKKPQESAEQIFEAFLLPEHPAAGSRFARGKPVQNRR